MIETLRNNEFNFIKELLENSPNSIDPKDCSFKTIILYKKKDIKALIEHLRNTYSNDEEFTLILNSLEKNSENHSIDSQQLTTTQLVLSQLASMDPIASSNSIEDLMWEIEKCAHRIEQLYIAVKQPDNHENIEIINNIRTDSYIKALIQYLGLCKELKDREDEISIENAEIAQELYGNQHLYVQMLDDILESQPQTKKASFIKMNDKIPSVTVYNPNISITKNTNNKWYNNDIFIIVSGVVGAAVSTAASILIYYAVFNAMRSAIFGNNIEYTFLQNVASFAAAQAAITAVSLIITCPFIILSELDRQNQEWTLTF